MQKRFIIILLLLLPITLSGCNVNHEEIKATSVDLISPKSEIEINEELQLYVEVKPSTANQDVTYSSSNPTIAFVSQTGLVKGLKAGSVIIKVVVKNSKEITDEIHLEVKAETIPIIQPQQIIIEGESLIGTNESTTLSARIIPQEALQAVIWSSSDERYATVNQEGEVSAKMSGEVTITARSVVDNSIYCDFEIRIMIVDPAPIDLEGYNIRIMSISQENPWEDFYPYRDRAEKSQALETIEKLYNCRIIYVPMDNDASWGINRRNWIKQQSLANNPLADFIYGDIHWFKDLATADAIVDLTSFYQKMKPYMGAEKAKTYSYDGKIYGFPYCTDGATVYVNRGIYYNYDLLTSLGLESPAKLFNEGKWTYTDFANYVKNANSKISGNKSVLSGNLSLYYLGMMNAASEKIVDTNSLNVKFDSQNATSAISILKDLYHNTTWGDEGWDYTVPSFNLGNSLFQVGNLSYVKEQWSSNLWDQSGNSKFGYVPFPYPDHMNKANTKTNLNSSTCLMMINHGKYINEITAEQIFYVFSQVFIETDKLIEENPNFEYPTVMKTYVETKFDDPESVKAVFFFDKNKIIFDPVMEINRNALSDAINKVIKNNDDYFSAMNNIKSIYLNHLNEYF